MTPNVSLVWILQYHSCTSKRIETRPNQVNILSPCYLLGKKDMSLVLLPGLKVIVRLYVSGCAKAGRPARTYIQQLCEDTGCNAEDLPEAMNDREKWRERVRDIRAGSATWWWSWYVNALKTEYMRYNQTGDLSTLDGTSLKLVDKFNYHGSSVSSTEKDIDTWLTKAWAAIDRLAIIWKSDLTGKIKHSFFQAAVVSILLYGCTSWTLTKRLEKKLDGNYTRMLRAILNKTWQQHPTRHQLYGHLPLITKTSQIRRTRHAGHCCRSRDELISDVLLWTPTYSQAKARRIARTYTQQLCEDTGCSSEDLLEAMNDREKWQERTRDIRASGTKWWCWWYQVEGDMKTSWARLLTDMIHFNSQSTQLLYD